MSRVVALSIFVAAVAAASEPVKVVQSARMGQAGSPVPIMDHGWLVFIDKDAPNIYVQRPDGSPSYTATIHVPSGVQPWVTDAAFDEDGRAAVTISYRGGETGAEGAIVLLDATGKQTAVHSTGRYLPEHICFDARGTMWTTGWQRDLVKMDTEDREDYAVIRRFKTDGTQTGAFVNRSTFPRPGLAPGTATGQWGIRWSRDRLGAYLMSGQTSERMVWLELDPSGTEIGRWTLDNEHTNGRAFVAGELYARVQRNTTDNSWVSALVRLDRKTGHWETVTETPNGGGIIMGADGDNIVITQDMGKSYQWIKP